MYSQPTEQHFTDERHRQMRKRPMNPRIDDIRRQNDVQINFDPRVGYRPGPHINQQVSEHLTLRVIFVVTCV